MTYTIQRDDLQFVDDIIKHDKQSWTRETTLKWNGFKIRTHIERDFYNFQSRIYVDVFAAATLEWKRLQTLSGSDHGDLASSSSKDDVAIVVSSNDLMNELIAYAQMILA